MSLKEKLLQKKKERQAEAQKSDVKLEEFSDEEYDTQRRFRVIYCHIVSNFFVTMKTLVEGFFSYKSFKRLTNFLLGKTNQTYDYNAATDGSSFANS